MKDSKVQRIHYLLLVYIVLQSIWWMYSIFLLSKEVFSAEEMRSKRWMIFGEGAVFLIILLASFLFALRTLKKELRLSKQQKNFLMAVTHELKTPISSIKLYLQTLLKRDLEENKKKEILTKSVADADRLNNLVESILLATKIEDHSIELSKTETNLSDFVERTCLTLLEKNSRGIDLELMIQPDIIEEVDPEAWTSILNNLVENALKYSDSGSTIKVHLVKENQELQLLVTDQGPGVPTDERDKIFEKFYRIGNENTRKEKGTGLGLFIAKYLVEQSGGEISVKKNSPKGAIFACKFLTQ